MLRPLTTVHRDAALALWQQPGVRRYLWDDRIITPDQALDPLRVSERDFLERRFGLWGLHLPENPALLGFCGLRAAELMAEPELLFYGSLIDAEGKLEEFCWNDCRVVEVGTKDGCLPGWDRDEWDVAMADGTIYRLVVERGVGQWFLEGVID